MLTSTAESNGAGSHVESGPTKPGIPSEVNSSVLQGVKNEAVKTNAFLPTTGFPSAMSTSSTNPSIMSSAQDSDSRISLHENKFDMGEWLTSVLPPRTNEDAVAEASAGSTVTGTNGLSMSQGGEVAAGDATPASSITQAPEPGTKGKKGPRKPRKEPVPRIPKSKKRAAAEEAGVVSGAAGEGARKGGKHGVSQGAQSAGLGRPEGANPDGTHGSTDMTGDGGAGGVNQGDTGGAGGTNASSSSSLTGGANAYQQQSGSFSFFAKDSSKRRKLSHPANYVPPQSFLYLTKEISHMLFIFSDAHGVEDSCARVVEEALRSYMSLIGQRAIALSKRRSNGRMTPVDVLLQLQHNPELMIRLRSIGQRDPGTRRKNQAESSTSAQSLLLEPSSQLSRSTQSPNLPVSPPMQGPLVAPRFSWMNDFQFVMEGEHTRDSADKSGLDPWRALGIPSDRTVGLSRDEYASFLQALQHVLQFRKSRLFHDWLTHILEYRVPDDSLDILGIVFLERVREITTMAISVRQSVKEKTLNRLSLESCDSSSLLYMPLPEIYQDRRLPLHPIHYMEAIRRLALPIC